MSDIPARGSWFGARPLDRGRCAFRLWAPAARGVELLLEDRPPLPMEASGAGWFVAIVDCLPGTRYRYRLADGVEVPDPASRWQPADVHGPSVVTDPAAYRWREREWRGRPWVDSVIYELHVGACGGYKGVLERLPSLATLGVTTVELMPLADFAGQRNWGYDGVLPYAPDSAYGTPEELKRLIDGAHALGLSVMLDVVYNHFGPDGNFLARYAPQFFRDDVQTPWGPAIDFRRPEVRSFFVENALYWLDEFRFDGLRLDAVHAMHDAGVFLDELVARVRTEIEPDRQVHLVLENEANDAALLRRGYRAQWNDDLHNALHVLLTGETHGYYANFARAPAQALARALGEGFAYQGEASPTHARPRGTPSADLPPSAFVAFLQNHDQIGNRAFGERLTRLADAEALRAAVTLQLLCPQVPLIFMGEEWGDTTPFLFFTDFHDALAQAVREGRRAEFSGAPGFADAAERARIPDPNAEATFRASVPDPQAASTLAGRTRLAQYRQLLELRRSVLRPRLAGARSLGAGVLGRAAVRAAWRLGDGSEWHVFANFDPEPVAAPTPQLPVLHASSEAAAREIVQGTLRARSCCVLHGQPR